MKHSMWRYTLCAGLLVLIFTIPLLMGSMHCTPRAEQTVEDTTVQAGQICNSVYYWKTTFTLNEWERSFLAENNVKRLYLRYFDVVPDESNDPVPEATLAFRDTIPPGIEVVPTVFILNSVFRYKDMMPYATKLVDRILTMSATNDVAGVREVQLDCDWTKTTQEKCFAFMAEVRRLLAGHGIEMSSTIRLHQLSSEAPPAGRGVLMCYNTGAVRSSDTGNSILSSADVAPYARNLKKYALPLDLAYPAFDWAVWFRDDEFCALLRAADPSDPHLTHVKDNIYKVTESFYQERNYLIYGDIVRFEFSDFDQITEVKNLLEPQLGDHSVILYHLDSSKLSKFTPDEISYIYGR